METRDGSDERESGKTFIPGETFADVEPAPLPPLAPDGGPVPIGIAPPPAAPPATPESMMCLRGPCTHYWFLETTMPSGNPEDTWKELGVREPRQLHHICLVHPGLETELTDDCVYRCSRWDPVDLSKQAALENRRDLYYAMNPDHRPDEDEKTIMDLDEDDEELQNGIAGTEG
jgi:hypothetical protein